MQFHKGLRLKKIVEKKFKRSKDFAQKIGFTEQKLQYYFSREDIKMSSLEPIVKELGLTYEQFMTMKAAEIEASENVVNEDYAPYGPAQVIAALENENAALKELVEVYKKQVALLEKKK